MGYTLINDSTGEVEKITEGKSRNWTAVLYPDSMVHGWQDKIYRLLQVPFEYIIHDKDEVEIEEDKTMPRKAHVHIIIHYGAPTTYKNIYNMLVIALSGVGKRCLNKIEPVRNLGYLHKYLTHSTADAIKEGKFRYQEDEIIDGNNWDLGAFVDLEDSDKLLLYRTVRDYCVEKHIRTCIGLEKAIEHGCLDKALPDLTRDMIIQYISNNRNKFVQICKEVNFSLKQVIDEKGEKNIEKKN